eukprot:snap_masked-scaffold_101-processed-gene-0.14-mRNA-1 protein AED:1.00 eAED:1.00 QI:0/0/0/0/1/1/3/0/67
MFLHSSLLLGKLSGTGTSALLTLRYAFRFIEFDPGESRTAGSDILLVLYTAPRYQKEVTHLIFGFSR